MRRWCRLLIGRTGEDAEWDRNIASCLESREEGIRRKDLSEGAVLADAGHGILEEGGTRARFTAETWRKE